MANYAGGQRRKIDLAIAGIRAGIENLEDDDVAGLNSSALAQVRMLTSSHISHLIVMYYFKPLENLNRQEEQH